MSDQKHFLGDNPIKTIKEDLFNFEHYAFKVQKLIQNNSNNSNPFTIGIYGKWGEGKTSFLNLLESKIDIWKKGETQKGILKYHFNPWRYSTEEEMLFDFFDGLAKTMFVEKNSKLQKVGKGILRFSKYLKAVKISASAGITPTNKVSATLEPSEIFKALGEDLLGKDITLDKLKDKINEALKVSNYKIVVFVDDIDRLDKDEIYTILKLIKLNGSFENFIYIVTLDSYQVSKAIASRYGNEEIDGALFLEKIINIPIHLPKVEYADLRNFFDKKIDEINKNLILINSNKKDRELQEIRSSFSPDYFNTPREIIRVFNSFFIGAFAIGDEVNLYDLFWVEYLKVKYPKTYKLIKEYSHTNRVTTLSETILDFNDNFDSKEKPNGSRLEIRDLSLEAHFIVDFLFPVEDKIGTVFAKSFDKEKMQRELRVNTIDNFNKYFSYHVIRKISNIDIFILKKSIKEKDSKTLKTTINNITVQAQNELHRVFYIFEDLNKTLTIEDGKLFWFEFICSNIEFVPNIGNDMFGLDYPTRIVEQISTQLNETENNVDFIKNIAKKLDYDKLCFFIRKINDEKSYKKDLEKLVVFKLKKERYIKNPFYLRKRNKSNRFIMHFWKTHFPKEYEQFLEVTLKSKEELGLLIREFVAFWNNTFYGGMSVDGYKAAKRLLLNDLIINKIKKFDNELFLSVDENVINISEFEELTVDDNLKQFIYHYKNDKEVNS